MDKLKPCPFCGGEAKVYAFTDGGICIKCLSCYCQTQATNDLCIADARRESAYEKIVRAWNRRPESSEENKMSELKPCPYRVHGERTMSLTVAGEYYYNEYFMPCMEEKCACFHRDDDDAYCDRNGAYMKLKEEKCSEKK